MLRIDHQVDVKMKIGAIFLLLLSADASATSCWMFLSDDPLKEAIHVSDVVFVGEAQSRRKVTFRHKDGEEYILEINTVFLIDQAIKGDVEGEIIVMAKSGVLCQCRYDFEPGVKYLVLASLEGEKYVTKYCRFIKPADEDVTSQARGRIDSDS